MSGNRQITITVKGSKQSGNRRVNESKVKKDVMDNVRASFGIEGSTISDSNWKKMKTNVSLLENII